MRSILCFGDSNTWGEPPERTRRFDWRTRWPGVMQKALGSEYRVIEDGLCGRTSCWNDPLGSNRRGMDLLPIALETHSPLDAAIIMLGTNDMKARFNLTSFTIAQGMAELVRVCQTFDPKVLQVILVCPPPIAPTENLEVTLNYENCARKSQELSDHYRYFALQLGCHFVDAGRIIESSPIDGIHLAPESHKALGEAMAKEIFAVFSES